MRNRLKEFRARFGMTQQELAGKVGVTRQTINAIESGRSDPSLPLAIGLARLFKTTVEELFPYDEE